MLPDELEAVRKAKMLYLSCMNESESNTFDLLTTSKKGVKKNKKKQQTKKLLNFGSHPGEGGLQADAEDAQTGRVSMASSGRRAGQGAPVVGGAVEPPQDAGGDEEPARQECPHPPVRLSRRQKLLPLHHQGEVHSV